MTHFGRSENPTTARRRGLVLTYSVLASAISLWSCGRGSGREMVNAQLPQARYPVGVSRDTTIMIWLPRGAACPGVSRERSC